MTKNATKVGYFPKYQIEINLYSLFFWHYDEEATYEFWKISKNFLNFLFMNIDLSTEK